MSPPECWFSSSVWWFFWRFAHLCVTVHSPAWVFSSLQPVISREGQDELLRGKGARACLLAWMLSTTCGSPALQPSAHPYCFSLGLRLCWLLLSTRWPGEGCGEDLIDPAVPDAAYQSVIWLSSHMSECVTPRPANCLCPLTLAWSFSKPALLLQMSFPTCGLGCGFFQFTPFPPPHTSS